MKITDNFSITRLFVDKTIKVSIDGNNVFSIKLKTVRQMLLDDRWNFCYYILTSSPSDIFPSGVVDKDITNLNALKLILFEFGQFGEFRFVYTLLLEQLPLLFAEEFKIDSGTKNIIINNTTITSEIWDYIVYLLKLSYGEKVSKPQIFDSEEAKQFFLAQQKYEEKIRRIKQKPKEGENVDRDGIIKIFLSIVYAFPSLTFDYLFDQTMAQIQWLQQYAAGSVSYEVNAKAFAAGNMKKGSKLDFFIK